MATFGIRHSKLLELVVLPTNTEVYMSNSRVLELVQEIGGILIKNNIPCLPVNLDYLDVVIATGQTPAVLSDLIIELQEELAITPDIKCQTYLNRFIQIFQSHIDGNSFISQKQIVNF